MHGYSFLRGFRLFSQEVKHFGVIPFEVLALWISCTIKYLRCAICTSVWLAIV